MAVSRLAGFRVALVKVVYDSIGATPIPPIGILMVGGELRKAGCEVKVFHLERSQALSRVSEIAAFSPGMVGFSLITGDPLDVVVEMTRQLDAALPECRIVYGGVHPTLDRICVLCASVRGSEWEISHGGPSSFSAPRAQELRRAGEREKRRGSRMAPVRWRGQPPSASGMREEEEEEDVIEAVGFVKPTLLRLPMRSAPANQICGSLHPASGAPCLRGESSAFLSR